MSKPSTAAGPLVEAINVHKTYAIGRRSLEVLSGVDLTIGQKEFVAVRGASGAGKSTLLHLLGGLDRPTEGHIRFEGEEIDGLSRSGLARLRNRHIGFVFQAYHLLPELNALENVCLPARMARETATNAERQGLHLLDRVGLTDRIDHRPYELSGGEQQRVALARALMNRPSLLLADEPTGNLDSRTGGEIIQLLIDLQGELGMTLVIATHDAHVAACAPRIVDLLDGNVAPSAAATPPAGTGEIGI